MNHIEMSTGERMLNIKIKIMKESGNYHLVSIIIVIQ